MNGVAAAILAVVLFVGWRLERWLSARSADRHALELQRLRQARKKDDRELALKEREVALQEAKEKTPELEVPPVAEFPAHILATVIDESEEWAREDGLRLIGESFLEAKGNWEHAGVLLSARYGAQPPSRLAAQLLEWNRIPL